MKKILDVKIRKKRVLCRIIAEAIAAIISTDF